MSLETGSFVNDFVITNPESGDLRAQGDDHLRLIKTLLKATFPNASKAFYFPETEAKSADFTVVAADMHNTFLVTTTGGSVTATLPSLASGDAGWECSFVKVTTDTNPMFIAPPSGTIQSGEYSGLAKTRRCIPGRRTRVFWTGTAFIAERVVNQPIGSFIPHGVDSTPVGYELAYGQTLSSASTNYPDYYSANGSSGVVLDWRGRVGAGQDDMGGSSANRLTGLSGGVNGDTFGATGGAESHTLTEAQLPTVTPAGEVAVSITGMTFHKNNNMTSSGGSISALAAAADTEGTDTTSFVSGTALGEFTGTPFGNGAAHNNVQPTIIVNMLVVVE